MTLLDLINVISDDTYIHVQQRDWVISGPLKRILINDIKDKLEWKVSSIAVTDGEDTLHIAVIPND